MAGRGHFYKDRRVQIRIVGGLLAVRWNDVGLTIDADQDREPFVVDEMLVQANQDSPGVVVNLKKETH